MHLRKGIALAGVLATLGVTFLSSPFPSTARAEAQPREPVADVIGRIGIDQRMGEMVPGDLLFRDHEGKQVKLSDYYGGKPIILVLVYNECPMLCNMVLSGLLGSLKAMTLNPSQDFEILAVSFDPREGPTHAAAKRTAYIERFNRPGTEKGWHFLTGERESIARLTESVGFRYEFDASTGQYAHASGIMVLTPEGKLSRYFLGTDFSPKDLRLALVESSDGKVGDLSDDLMLLCYRYDPKTNKYSARAIQAVRLGGITTVSALGGFIFVMLRRERRIRKSAVSKEVSS